MRKATNILDREKCLLCDRWVAKHHKRKDGTWSYMALCGTHNREKYGMPIKPLPWSRGIRFPNNECSRCGWEGPCDRHRLNRYAEGSGYVEGYVVILCPNCHRLEHMKEPGKPITAIGKIVYESELGGSLSRSEKEGCTS